MSYVKSILQPNERIITIGKLHWIIYAHAIWLVIAGGALVLVEYVLMNGNSRSLVVSITAVVFGVAIAISFVRAWFIRWITGARGHGPAGHLQTRIYFAPHG